MAKYYISIDVATRSLAIGLYKMEPFDSIHKLSASEDPRLLNTQLDNIIMPIFMKVWDITEGKKIKDESVVSKCGKLKLILQWVDHNVLNILNNESMPIVLIEYQMCANYLSNAIFNMIMYHYVNVYSIYIMPPALKNSIAFHPKLTISEILGKSSSNYQANKNHSKFNMLYFLYITDRSHMIKDIAKKNYDDIADTLMQAIAFHKRNNS